MSRRDARRLALRILYESDVAGTPAAEVMERHAEAGESVEEFARELVEGTGEHLGEIDELIQRHAKDWTVARMPAVDRAILRLACFEIVYLENVPASVAVNEAVEAAKELSTEESGRFVNGVLGAVAREAEG